MSKKEEIWTVFEDVLMLKTEAEGIKKKRLKQQKKSEKAKIKDKSEKKVIKDKSEKLDIE